MTFRDDREAQKHRIDALEDELAAARAEADRLRAERDEAVAEPRVPQGFTEGSSVWVEWRGKWYPATIRDVLGPSSWQIHYDGWSSQWDEAVGPNRIVRGDRTPPGPRAMSNGMSLLVGMGLFVLASFGVYLAVGWSAGSSHGASSSSIPAGAAPYDASSARVGDTVWILWSSTWYAGTVIGLEGSYVRVHYDGWSDSSDETVSADRLMQR